MEADLPESGVDALPSLGDPAVVAGLVRAFLREVVDRVADVGSGVLGGGAAGFADVEACRGMAAMFLGQREGYEVVAGWNSGGGMVGLDARPALACL
jgi:hypothetical protein